MRFGQFFKTINEATKTDYQIPDTNLYVTGFGKDVNGNSTLSVNTPNQRARSIQRLNILNGETIPKNYWEDASPKQVKKINDAIVDYVEKHMKGIKLQKYGEKKTVGEGRATGLSPDAKNYLEFLKDTLIPDLKEAGKEATAKDFGYIVHVIEKGKLPAEVKEYGWETVSDFIGYLEDTLIPDLKEAGQKATAGSFEEGIGFMKERK